MRRIKGAEPEVNLCGRKGEGINSTISISKTRKITASKKNRIEKGIRAFLFGSNPHSNGEHFSRSSNDRKVVIRAIESTTPGITRAVKRVRLVSSIL